MKNLILFLLCVLIAIQGYAQENDADAKETESVVDTTTDYETQPSSQEKHFNRLTYTLQTGMVLDDSNTENILRGNLTFTAIYRVNQFLQLGLGTEIYRISSFNLVPIYIQYQGNLSQDVDNGFYYYGAIGKGFSKTVSNCECSFYDTSLNQIIKVGLGYRLALLKLPFNLSVGWTQVKMESMHGYDYIFFDRGFNSSYHSKKSSNTMKQQLNSLEFKIGVTF